MDTFQNYLPIDRRLALAAGIAIPDRVYGAVLFADISGFTPLTAALVRELGSRRGAEALIVQLNRVYSALVSKVHLYGGAAINFSGDSITCWFDAGDPQALPDTTAGSGAADRALACAMELQQTMDSLQAVITPGGLTIPLGLKVGVAFGPARRFLAGDPHSYVLEVLAGMTLNQMAAGEELANRGEVVVTSDLLNGLATPPTVREWRHDAAGAFAVIEPYRPTVAPHPWPAAETLAEEVARPWLLPPVYAHLQQAPEAFLAELRNSVTLFVRFSGIDYDADDEAGAKLNTYVCQVQDVLGRYQGYLLQITMGDKGGYLHASFGAPIAHEDDAERAASAALEIRTLTEGMGYLDRPQIGISSGVVHSGAYGSPQRRTYGVVGNDVNISARLMTVAQPGQILVSSRVTEAIVDSFELRSMPPITLKGMPDPLPVWALETHRQTGGAALPDSSDRQMIGRETEETVMDEVLADLQAGRSGILIIEGEAGIGKSLLTQELTRKVRALGETVEGPAPPLILAGYGDAVEQSTSYFAWRPIFEQAFGLRDGARNNLTTAERQQRVMANLDPDARHLAPLLSVILTLDLPETELTEQIVGEARQDNIHRLLVNTLRPIAAINPLILILDDVQWLDSVSWTLVRRVQRDVMPLLLILVTRPMGDEQPVTFAALRQLPTVRPLFLDTLSPAAIEELVCRRLGVTSLPPQVSRLIQNKAEGHPFFSEELAYALRDRGLIETHNGEARLVARPDELLALDFPDSIEGVITSRIDELPPSEQLTVKVASVIGRVFAFRVLYDIYPAGRDRGQLHSNLEHLQRLDITPLETPDPDLAYYFRHILTQEVVYDLMTTGQKRQLHHVAAMWYEQSDATDQDRLYPLIAHHYELAGDRSQAAMYYAKAGENAFRDYANQEAIRFLGLALELSDGDVPSLQRAHWHTLIGEAGYRLTLMAQSEEHYKAALTLLGNPWPTSVGRRGWGLGRQLVRQLGYRQLPRRFMSRISPDERAVLLEAARAYEGLAEVVYNAGDQLGAFYGVMSTLNLAERAGPSPELIRSYANIASASAIFSRSMAEAYRSRALTLAADSDDMATRAAIQIPLSAYSMWIGDWDRAEEETAVALDIYSRLGEWRRWGVAAWVLPQVSQHRGQLVRARDLWQQLSDVALRSEDTRHQVRSRGGQFFNFLALNQPEDAMACADQVDVLLSENPEMVLVEERLWYGLCATRALYQGNLEEARAFAHEQMAAIDRAKMKFDLQDVFAGPAEIMLSLSAQGVATEKETRKASKIIDSYARSYPFARSRALRLAGRLNWLAGKPSQAKKLWHKSLEQAEQFEMPYERALTLAVMGEALNRADCQAEAADVLAQCRAETAQVLP